MASQLNSGWRVVGQLIAAVAVLWIAVVALFTLFFAGVAIFAMFHPPAVVLHHGLTTSRLSWMVLVASLVAGLIGIGAGVLVLFGGRRLSRSGQIRVGPDVIPLDRAAR